MAARRSPGTARVSGPRTAIADGRQVDRPARVPGGPRATGRGHELPAGSTPGRGLQPSDDPVLVARGLDETDQARALLEERSTVGVGSAHDIGPCDRARGARRPARSGRSSSRSPRRSTRSPGSGPPWPTSGGRSSASSAASSTRCRRCGARSREASIRSASCSTARRRGSVGCGPRSGSPTTGCAVGWTRSSRRRPRRGALQESLVTLRNGRYVVPVKAEARSRVKGIVHDASGSGQTLFVEPLVAVELGNAWREAQAAEREEIERILDELSALVAANAGPAARVARRRWPGSTCGPPRRGSRPRWTPPGRRRPTDPRSSCSAPAIRA